MSKPLILDGGVGRELKRIGAPFRQPEWSALALMEAPEQVFKVHRSFIEAGAQVITTNNYAVVPYHIGTERFEQDGESLTALAGRLARDAADAGASESTSPSTSPGNSATVTSEKVWVGGSLPPLSGSYRPDLYNASVAAKAYPLIVSALEPYVDIWQAETMVSIAEARAVATAVSHGDKPLWLAFTLKDEPELAEPCLRSGESLQAAIDFALEVNAEALLFNCCLPEVVGQALAVTGSLRDQLGVNLQLGGYGNTFTPRGADAEANSNVAELRAEVSPEHYAAMAAEWRRSGATIIGGCCGIGPEHIAELARCL
ncbi:hypothetical protein AB833_28385 [Chromatiales bacterium (ex Bugula neritina AB1)]|nr:hypothetical protein AB833_28385 [Chromatiales bacterium (ex Bugula neritina AB1)]